MDYVAPVSAPTGNGDIRGREYAGQPGKPLPLRPERADANDASSMGWHVTGNKRAADGDTNMYEDLKFGKPMADSVSPAPSRSHLGDPSMGSKVIMGGKPNR